MRWRLRQYDRHQRRTDVHCADNQRRHSPGYVGGHDFDGAYNNDHDDSRRLLRCIDLGGSGRRIDNRGHLSSDSGHPAGEHAAR
ncbi:MAG: hypothetical protein ACLP8S_33625 [Solirubrobacteraceae bacterium]